MRRFLRTAVYVLAIIGLLWVPAARAVVFVAPEWTVPVGPANSEPVSIAVADFNEDGNPDFAVSDAHNDTVSIFEGDGAGGFSGGSVLTVATGPAVQVATADFNGDGHADLVVAEDASSCVSILLGDGTGQFTSETAVGVAPISCSDPAVTVAVGDFNRDGHPDLAVTTQPGTVEIFLGDGRGGFTFASSFSIGGTSAWGYHVGGEKLVVSDFNGDGHLDLAAAGDSGVSVWLGDGTGHFTEASGSPYGFATSLAVGDLNNDGRPDLIALYTTSLTVLLNDGRGSFTPTSQSPITVEWGSENWYPFSVVAADFNGDGNLDLATGDDAPELLLGDGHGDFSVAPGAPFVDFAEWNTGPGENLVTADVNRDGHPDLLGTWGTNVRVLLNAPPDTSIASGPADSTRSTTASFAFSSHDAPVTYQCNLDGGGWATCAAQQDYPGLAAGPHTLSVRAVAQDAGDRTDPTPATWNWTVDLSTPPVAALSAPPSPVLTGNQVTLDASASHDPLDGGSIVDYQWDFGSGSFTQDTGSTPTATTSFSAPGSYTVRVKVTNNVGDSAIASGTVDALLAPPPGNVGVSINDGDYATNSPDVQLYVVWPAYASQALISNDGGFGAAGGTETVPLAATIPWTLRSEANEKLTKVVYLRFPDSSDPLLTFSDDIVLDTTTPVVQSASSAGTSSTPKPAPRATSVVGAGRTYKVRIQASENRSGISQAQFSRVRRGGTVVSLRSRKVRGIRRLARVLTVRMSSAPRWVRVRSTAGNWSTWHRIR